MSFLAQGLSENERFSVHKSRTNLPEEQLTSLVLGHLDKFTTHNPPNPDSGRKLT